MLNGFINIDKPTDFTSHDVVAVVRRALGRKEKVGHTGTLDPQATGVLPICVGKATRLAEYVQDLPKTYEGEITFGITTTTLDIWGEVVDSQTDINITEEQIVNILPSFSGKIMQLPPMVSAVKVDGKRLYELARAGITVERKTREVEIFNLQLLSTDFTGEYPTARLRVKCSSGTYIRTLFADIGERLGLLACLSALVRTEAGGFDLVNSYKLSQVEEMAAKGDLSFLQPLNVGISHLEKIVCDDKRLLHGLAVPCEGNLAKLVSVFDSSDKLLGIGSIYLQGERNLLKLDKVLSNEV